MTKTARTRRPTTPPTVLGMGWQGHSGTTDADGGDGGGHGPPAGQTGLDRTTGRAFGGPTCCVLAICVC
jgi:hypothetical protein